MGDCPAARNIKDLRLSGNETDYSPKLTSLGVDLRLYMNRVTRRPNPGVVWKPDLWLEAPRILSRISD